MKPGFQLKFFSFLFLGSRVSPPVLAPPAEHQNFVWMSEYLQHMQYFFDLLGWPGKRSSAAPKELGSTLSIKVVPISTHCQWQQIQADLLLRASTPALEREILHLAHTVWAQDDAHKTWQRACCWATSSFELSKC